MCTLTWRITYYIPQNFKMICTYCPNPLVCFVFQCLVRCRTLTHAKAENSPTQDLYAFGFCFGTSLNRTKLFTIPLSDRTALQYKKAFKNHANVRPDSITSCVDEDLGKEGVRKSCTPATRLPNLFSQVRFFKSMQEGQMVKIPI